MGTPQCLSGVNECRSGITDEAGQRFELLVVAISPPVNGLLTVAHDHAHFVQRHQVFEKLNQVVPLGNRCVLELIDEEVAVPVADALVYKRRGIVADNGGDFPVESGQQAHIFFPLHSSEFIADQTEGADQAHALLQMLFEFELPPRLPFVQVTPRL